jgi:putative peptidoglycan lipid II flippase
MGGAHPMTGPDRDSGLLASAVRIISGLTILSRLAGLVRDVLIARVLGADLAGSAFAAAYAVPNVFRRLFGEGALTAAFLPEYSRLRRDDPARARALAARVLRLMLLVTSALTLVGLGVILFRLALPTPPELSLSLKLIALMLPMMPMICLLALLGGMLQARGDYAIPAAAPIVLNLFQIIAGTGCAKFLTAGDKRAAFAIGAAALAACLITIVWSLRALASDFTLAATGDLAQDNANAVLQRFVPAAIGLGTLQLNTLCDMAIAMWPVWIGPTMFGRPCPLDVSSQAVLRFSQTIAQFPLGVFGIAVATAIFPLLSRHAHEPPDFLSHLRRGLRLSLFIALPASAGLLLLAGDIPRLLYGGASGLSEDHLHRCSRVLLGFAAGMWASSLNQLLTRAFYARGDTRTPMRVAVFTVLLNLACNLAFIWNLREAGMAWATATTALLQALVLFFLLRRALRRPVLDRPTISAVTRIFAVTLAMSAVVLLLPHALPADSTWRSALLRVAIGTAAGVAAYALLARLLRCDELRWLFQKAPRGPGTEGFTIE